MKNFKIVSIFALLLATLFSFNSYAMKNVINGDFVRPDPLNEDESSGFKWTWISDTSCVKFAASEKETIDHLSRMYNLGMISQWAENGTSEKANVVSRYTYSGKWSQSEEGTKIFVFDDNTIPVGVTKIDGILYAFNGYGELKAGYEYYTGFKAEADGIIKADSAEFTQWLGTQYLPDCTSHE